MTTGGGFKFESHEEMRELGPLGMVRSLIVETLHEDGSPANDTDVFTAIRTLVGAEGLHVKAIMPPDGMTPEYKRRKLPMFAIITKCDRYYITVADADNPECEHLVDRADFHAVYELD